MTASPKITKGAKSFLRLKISTTKHSKPKDAIPISVSNYFKIKLVPNKVSAVCFERSKMG